jgi:predicted ribosome quality control (RQC) complex YloA/Tae2 family protein
MFLLDEEERITHALRPPRGEGQQIGEKYQPPEFQSQPITPEKALEKEGYESLSAAADDYYRRLQGTEAFAARFKALRSPIQRELAQRAKLKSNLTRDLATHGDPEAHKRIGDLLLANIASAQRDGNMLSVVDYYSEGTPIIKVEVDENTSLQDEASRSFARYSKAKRAREEIAARLVQLEDETTRLQEKLAELAGIVERRDEAALDAFEEANKRTTTRQVKQKGSGKIPGVRRYQSSDDYEVLVGRAARDNDQLTFKIARPHDLWLHAADYPGSHVIIRSHNRNEIPYRTIIEAAQLAAKFSQASNDSKVTVHYTQRKFLSKPKRAAPGVVRMSSFKTITVEPKEVIERL